MTQVMTMKTTHNLLAALCVAACVAASVRAAQEKRYYESKSQHDLFLMVAGIDEVAQNRGKTPPKSDEMLLFGFCTVTNPDCIVYWPRSPQSLCSVELLDENGKSVQKTKEGRKYGSAVPAFPNDDNQLVRQHVEPYGYDQGPAWELFKTVDLFELPKRSGNFILRLNVQVEKVQITGTNAVKTRVRLPTMEVPVVHLAPPSVNPTNSAKVKEP
jgi:hypothetical protein